MNLSGLVMTGVFITNWHLQVPLGIPWAGPGHRHAGTDASMGP